MTIEEAKTLAEQGNTDAMLALADFYSKQNDDENAINVAYQYYELAANAGEPTAILKMARTSRTVAGVAVSMIESMGRVDSMDADIEKAYHWAAKLEGAIRNLNISDGETLAFVKENLVLAVSRLSTMYYFDEKFDDVARITRNIDHPYAKAVYGLAMYRLAETNGEIESAFDALKNIENEQCWREEYQTKFGQIVLLEAALYLSGLYRVINHDVNSAYRVMTSVLSYSTDESIRQDVKENISKHFKKKMFGGYKYIG